MNIEKNKKKPPAAPAKRPGRPRRACRPAAPAPAAPPPPSLAAQAEKLAIYNLLRRAKDGASLSATDWARLERLSAPQPQPTDNDPAAGLAALVAEARALQAAGRPLQHHHARALREAFLLSAADHWWPDLRSAAAELGLHQNTLRGYGAQGAPIAGKPLARAPLYRWLWQQATAELSVVAAGDADPKDQAQLELIRARTARLTGELIAQADDHARSACDQVAEILRDAFLGRGAADLWDLLQTATSDRDLAEDLIEGWIRARLDQALAAAPNKVEKYQ
jgi:hypothetical protein